MPVRSGDPMRSLDGAPGHVARAPPASIALALVIAGTIAHAAQPLLVPLALALLLTAALSPAVEMMVRKRIPRWLAVAAAMILVLGAIAGVVVVTGQQLPGLTANATAYRTNVRAKITDLHDLARSPTVRGLRAAVSGVQEEIAKVDEAPDGKTVDVTVDDGGILRHIPSIIEIVAHALLVAVLVGFFLARAPDLRGRIIRLFGYAQLAVTTKALDEASSLISRYLRSMCIVNGCFGLAVGAGMMLLGIPYAPLLALLAAALRFIPYLGAWIGALSATLVSLAAFPGWREALWVALLFAVLEPLTGMIAEPLVFGQRLGISDVGVLIAAMCWTWLWGPAGLLLATPITVCLVVLGRAVPSLAFLDVLFGEARPLAPHRLYYERLLVDDREAADEALEAHGREHSLERTFEQVMLPAILQAVRDFEVGRVSASEKRAVLASAQSSIRRMAESDAEGPEAAVLPATHAMGIAVGDEVDEMALWMIRALLPAGHDLEIIPAMDRPWRLMGGKAPAAVCLVAVSPRSAPRIRTILERLRPRFPEADFFLCRPLGPTGSASPGPAPASDTTGSLGEARDRIVEAVLVRAT